MTWIFATVVWSLLAAVWAFDAIRLRRRIAALAVLAPSNEPPSPQHRFLCAPGVVLDEATRRAASAHALRKRLEVLDLVPRDIPVWRALLFASTVDPRTFRSDAFAAGRSAGYALLVSADVLGQAESTEQPPHGDGAVLEWASRFKHYAMTTMDHAVAPGLSKWTMRDDMAARRLLIRALFGGYRHLVLTIQAILVATGLIGPFVASIAGLVALGLYQIQPLLIFAGTALRPRGLAANLLLRAPLELVTIGLLLKASSGAGRGPARAGGEQPGADRGSDIGSDPIAARRPYYQAMAAAGFERFQEPRREDCPLCSAHELAVHFATCDLLQKKPGRFTLERCLVCGHIFQNPRLSLEGLDYYYADFYDGIGEAGFEMLFGFARAQYLARARIVEGLRTPQSWLDVGAGHGHFCAVAREVWPGVRFDGLDLSQSIEQAERWRRVDRAYRGLFPELAPRLASDGVHYDVVSMSHYLEHTREPRAEIAAARQVLENDGLLFIEVPDPDSRLQKLLGRYWIPWFQPQHQHLLSVANITRLLVDEGFEPVRWHRGEAHQPVDFHFGLTLAIKRILPADVPWSPPQPAALHVVEALAWSASLPFIGAAWALDWLAAPLFRRPGWSNTYRVVARKSADLGQAEFCL